MSEAIINVSNVTKRYGKFLALNDVSLNVNRQDIYGIVGKNGAGKTTLIRVLINATVADSGSYSFNIQNRNETTLASIVEKPSLHEELTGIANLEVQSALLDLKADKEELYQILDVVSLDRKNAKKVKYYSLGMKQRLAIAMALLGKPEILILDEPTNGLDPQGIHELRELLLKLNGKGVTILISSHILSELSKVATRYAFMDKGKIVKEMTAEELSQTSKTKTAIRVSDAAKAAEVLVAKGFQGVEIKGGSQVEFEGKPTATELILTLSKENVQVENISFANDNLEDYFIKLVGGDAK